MNKIKAFLIFLLLANIFFPLAIIWAIICAQLWWAVILSCLLAVVVVFDCLVKKFWLELKYFLGYTIDPGNGGKDLPFIFRVLLEKKKRDVPKNK